MANRIKISGTTANAFTIGLNGVTLDSSNATSAYTLILPPNDGNNNQYLRTDGTGNLSWSTVSGGSGSPGGSNTQIQYNDDGDFGGSAAFIFDQTSNTVTVTGNVSANVYKLNLTAAQTADAGEMTWNASDGTMDLGMLNGVTQQVGQETYFYVKANAAITNGRVVMFDGAQGGTIKAKHANTASAGFKPSYVMGVATQDIALNADGYITAFGKVSDLLTNAFPQGSILWLEPNSDGNFTLTEPAAPGPKIQVAACLIQSSTPSATNGRIFVRPELGLHMYDLHDVSSNNAVTGDVLVYNSSNVWATSNTVPSANTAVTVTANSQPNITSVGTLANLTVTGNVSANYYIGNGSLLTGIATGTPNAIVNGTSNVSIPSANGNVVVNASGNLAITATGSNVVIGTGSGANITGANNISANTFTGTLTTAAQPNITSVGTLANANITGIVAVGNGTAAAPSVTFINDTNTGIYNVGADQLGISTGGTLRQTIANAAITATVPHYVANGTASAPSYTFTSDTNTGVFATGTADQIAMTTGGTQRFLLSNTSANFAGNVVATGNVQGNYVLGNGALLTGITTDATSITNGTSNVRAAASGNVTISVAGTSNVITVTSTNLVVNAVSQLGNLGNVKITGGTNGYFLQTDGVGNLVWAAGTVNATGNGTVAGSNTQIQFNDGASNFAASGALTFDTSSNTLTVGGTANISKLNLVQFDETVTNATTSGTLTPNVNSGSVFNYTLSGNVTINTLGNAVAGSSATLILKQDATGNRLLTSTMLFSGNIRTLSTSANAIDIMCVFYDGSTYYAALTKGYV